MVLAVREPQTLRALKRPEGRAPFVSHDSTSDFGFIPNYEYQTQLRRRNRPSGRLLTACDDGKARIWNLRPYGIKPEEFAQVSQAFSSRRIDSTGTALEPIEVATVKRAFDTLRVKYPALFNESLIGDRDSRSTEGLDHPIPNAPVQSP